MNKDELLEQLQRLENGEVCVDYCLSFILYFSFVFEQFTELYNGTIQIAVRYNG